MKNSEKQILSVKRYGIARLIRYISFIVIVLMFFMPILSITDTETVFGTKVTARASISPFQFIIGNTVTTPKISVSGNSNAQELLNSFSSYIDVLDEIDPSNNDEMLMFFRLAPLIIGIVTFFAEIFSIRMTNNMLYQESKKSQQNYILINRFYIKNAIASLPKILSALESMFFGMILSSGLFFGCIAYVGHNNNKTDFSLDIVRLLIFIVIYFILTSGAVCKIICSKDIKLIERENLRYENIDDKATISSDLQAIKGIFGVNNTVSANAEATAGNIDDLYKYKKLLDDGIISEEEFQEKKNELLNSKKDNV